MVKRKMKRTENNSAADILWVKLTDIKPYEHNPKSRGADITDLLESIKVNGFDPSRPIVVGMDLIIGDGHRRYFAAQQLKLTQVAIVIDFDHAAEEIYASHNSTQKRITSRQGLEWYLSKRWAGECVTPNDIPGLSKNTKSSIRMSETIGGSNLLRLIDRSGLSPSATMKMQNYVRFAYPQDDGSKFRKIVFARFGGGARLKNNFMKLRGYCLIKDAKRAQQMVDRLIKLHASKR